MRLWLVEWAILFAAWLLFVDEVAFYEWLVGAAVAALAVLGTELFRRREDVRTSLPPHWFLAILKALAAALRESVMLLARAPVHGRFVRVTFAPPDRGARAATRRMLAILLTSLSANSIVIGVDSRRKILLLHQAFPAPTPDVIRILEGK